jgi:hypothetical protein
MATKEAPRAASDKARWITGAITLVDGGSKLVCAHWAIVRGWAEPHYLTSFGLMPAGAVFADGGFAQV